MMLGFSWSLPNQTGTQALLVRISSQTVEPSGSVDQESSEIFLDVPTKRAEMALLVRTSFSPPRPNQAGRNGAVGRGFGAGFSRLHPNQSGQQALLVGHSSQPGWPGGFVGLESSDVFLVVPTKRAAMALLVGTFVSKFLPTGRAEVALLVESFNVFSTKRAEVALLVRISCCFSVSLTFFPIRPLLDLAIFVTL